MRSDIGAPNGEIEIDSCKEQQLYAEAEEVGQNCGDRYDHSGEIDLTEHALVSGEGGGGLVEAVGEIEPTDIASHVEQWLGDAVGAHLGDAAEDDHVHNDGEHWLHNVPQRSKDGLFILHHDVAMDKKGNQVAVTPDFLEIDAPQLLMGGNDEYIFLFHELNLTFSIY